MNSDTITLTGSPMHNKKKGGRKIEEEWEKRNKDNIRLKFKWKDCIWSVPWHQ